MNKPHNCTKEPALGVATSQISMKTSIHPILGFGAALIGALIIGFVSFVALVSFSECGWLGPLLNGSCRDGFGVAFVLALVVSGISFALLLRLLASVGKQMSSSSADRVPPSGLYWSWLALLCLQYAMPLMQLFVPGDVMYFLVAALILGVAFIAASAVLARYRARHPATALLALVPYIGPLIVGALLFKARQSAGTPPPVIAGADFKL